MSKRLWSPSLYCETRSSVLADLSMGRLLIPTETAGRSMFLMFRNEMERGGFVLDGGKLTLKEINLWSEMGKSDAVQLKGVKPEQHMRSRMCPLLCVGKSMCCCNPKLSSTEEKSLVRV